MYTVYDGIVLENAKKAEQHTKQWKLFVYTKKRMYIAV